MMGQEVQTERCGNKEENFVQAMQKSISPGIRFSRADGGLAQTGAARAGGLAAAPTTWPCCCWPQSISALVSASLVQISSLVQPLDSRRSPSCFGATMPSTLHGLWSGNRRATSP